jgi:hypothetical protein
MLLYSIFASGRFYIVSKFVNRNKVCRKHPDNNKISKDNKMKRKDDPEMSSEVAREFQTVLEF